MSQSHLTECPVCGKAVSLNSVNEHVDRCLQTSTPSEEVKTSPDSSLNQLKNFLDVLKSSGAKAKVNGSEKAPLRGQSSTKRGSLILTGKSTPATKKMRIETDVNKESSENTVKENGEHARGKETKPRPLSTTKNSKRDFVPLAERMRPKSLADYVGQSKVLGNNTLLRTLLQAEQVPSMIFWGPPGCGKTTLAHIIANNAKMNNTARFVSLSATTSGVNDVKEVVKAARNEQTMFKRKTILFVDEIHRFNKTQQDSFLPFVENGTITLIGATTENPSFKVNNALLSRCRVIVLEKLTTEDIEQILCRALHDLGVAIVGDKTPVNSKKIPHSVHPNYSDKSAIVIEKEALHVLAGLCDGDARVALNGLQLAVQSQVAMSTTLKCQDSVVETATYTRVSKTKEPPQRGRNFPSDEETDQVCTRDADACSTTVVKITVSHIKEGLQKTHLLYDRAGDEHYNIISAMHKSIRGGDASAALYWLARMLVGGEDPLYIARRLVRCASEDIGLADPLALNQAVAAYQACHFIGMPECDVILSQAVVYLARAPKSIEVYEAYNKARQCVKGWQGVQPCVPLHIRNAPTSLMKELGYGKGYKYNPSFEGPVDQTYLPPELDGADFFGSSRIK